MKRRAIVVGDSTNNTLSVIRSLGMAGQEQCLILKSDDDFCHVLKSKYLKCSKIFRITKIDECLPVLERLKEDNGSYRQTIICTFDEAAVFIDKHEPQLSQYFRTPTRGRQIGTLFNKDEQCKLAARCGLTPPRSQAFHRSDNIDSINIDYPILLKPQNSIRGEKSDIHICHNRQDVEKALQDESHCDVFVLQEFIDKEYELDCIGVRTEHETYIPGAVRKIRHYPWLIGAGAYGVFTPVGDLDIDVKGISLFLEYAGYYGPFSVEFLHKGNKNYFMEMNFRNEGLAQAATTAGANLHALYLDPDFVIDKKKVRKMYMMNYALDFLYVKDGRVPFMVWLRDFLRTSCFINFNRHDLMPTFGHYIDKFKHLIGK